MDKNFAIGVGAGFVTALVWAFFYAGARALLVSPTSEHEAGLNIMDRRERPD